MSLWAGCPPDNHHWSHACAAITDAFLIQSSVPAYISFYGYYVSTAIDAPWFHVSSFHFATGSLPALSQINDMDDRRMHKYTTRPTGTYTPFPYCTESS